MKTKKKKKSKALKEQIYQSYDRIGSCFSRYEAKYA